ncbi:MAG: hypothetical protein H6867_00805 [Rhodospirillales bacterium]|nr:hypothetical protein [Rhodospirillales bacterium]MCB9996801.1 hypothetical protein [Rhodospirillales bacterium]
MKIVFRHLIVMTLICALTGCAGPNGSASATHSGASARTDLFKISLPP